MRKVTGFIMSIGLALSLAACGAAPTEKQEGATAAGQGTSDKQVKIGVSQFVQHPALDSIYQGIKDGLKDKGFEEGKNLEVDYQNANGELNNTITIAQKFASDKKDVAVAIATPSAQALAKAIGDVPVVFTTVTDPVSAGLVPSLDKPDKNVTGTSDKLSMEVQLQLVQKFIPTIKKIGVIYTTAEVNAEVQVKDLQAAGQKMGIEVVPAGISSQNEVQMGTQSLIGKVEAIFIPIDNTVVASIEGVLGVAEKAKVPVFASDMDTVKRGAVATYGIDYYKMGKQTGEMVARILKGQSVADTPVEVGKDTELVINEKAAQKFGLTISDDLRKQAKEIVK
ncbi:ABC transporter substrate-binding protein [Brevibacillus laterosporus]|uniref:ABC transporter substrate-binding protein n=1 Tax=Brevibacillus laterosporus TaxID=1465 RepID=A0AAP3G7C0_BRELA|nr:ABC transporter substrate-binding protein [Brevibacillus laterosporus]MBG9790120.1 sugar ABC transporter substrate-binding protein [Brevibacillus laterosporus]MCR8980193.1 ABC transporter substrate-binding protein [Brevibacillus laterosporus]MCZ0807348.1 ABC transporter substrate-binding protein [Brevibacillus laterosporus]MCZ0825543.1 ABC transporter substrate-binding protein [Brevibacillus laterosporus]MCZ0849320.1 ABC transporter substrate-binding protein [Brevibacillus laterosporus]